MTEKIISCSPKQTRLFALKIINLLKRFKLNVICLYGELGTGKTTFVQGLAKFLGVKKRILSPTFVLVREYKLSAEKQKLDFDKLYHIDCYRLESEVDFKSFNLSELFLEPQNLITIEWAEKIEKILPKKRVELKFKYLEENKRKITVRVLNI